jgi:uncharacterized membrane protein YhaH (DUF805 family)
MGFGEAVATCFRKYVDFQGRARRSEFWFFRLFIVLVYVAMFVTVVALSAGHQPHTPNIPAGIALTAFMIFLLAVFLPDLAVSVRRLHDVGHSGWMYLIAFVPFGAIVLLVFFCQEGTRGDNRYGADPLGPSARIFE